jgi:hypothetical protein
MFEVALICSDCGEDTQEVVKHIDDVDHSESKSLLTSKRDGAGRWEHRVARPPGRLHRANGPARVFPSGKREWFRHGYLHRRGGPAVSEPEGRRAWFLEGEKTREEVSSEKALAHR